MQPDMTYGVNSGLYDKGLMVIIFSMLREAGIGGKPRQMIARTVQLISRLLHEKIGDND